VLDFDVDDSVLEPVMVVVISEPAFRKYLCPVPLEGAELYHSRNLSTQSFNSPLVSNFGYCTASTSSLGRA
jgi:hypothetical protein